MNTKQYIPASVNPLDCEYYGKDFPYNNQHMGEHRFHQSEGKSFGEYRHPQAVNMNSGQFIPSVANSYPCGVYGFNFPQNQNMNQRLVHNNVLPLNEQGNSHAINMATETYPSRATDYSVSDINRKSCIQQEHSVIPSEKLPVGSDPRDSRLARKEKQTRERTFVCDVCGRGFFEMSSLTVHSRLHSGERPFPCEVCDKTFASREGLRSHLVVHSQERPFPCDLCDKKFARKQQMQHHRLTHSSERPHVCDLCQKTFKCKKTLRIHKLSHTEERPHACDQCDKKFKTKGELKRHKIYHTKEKKFECELCSMRFFEQNKLKLHQRVHTGVKPYHCQLCPMRFSNKNSFLKHVRRHDEQSGSKTVDVNPDAAFVERDPRNLLQITKMTREPHMCPLCREEFAEQRELEKHRLHHKREKPFACFICRVRFFRSSNLKLHLSIIHSSRFTQVDSQGKSSLKSGLLPCEICDKSFRSKHRLQRHILLHLSQHNSKQRMFPVKQGEFPCDQCGKRFACRKNLRTHVLVHTAKRKPHQCVVCSKKFINRSLLRKHTRIHTGENYVCHFCHNRYTSKDSLVKHFREHCNEKSNLQVIGKSSDADTSDEDNISLAVLKDSIVKTKKRLRSNKYV